MLTTLVMMLQAVSYAAQPEPGAQRIRKPKVGAVCCRASWQLLRRDSHPLATTSLCGISYSTAPPTPGATKRG
jgi:hypothetical protein